MNGQLQWIADHLPEWRQALCFADEEAGVLVVKLYPLHVSEHGDECGAYDAQARRSLDVWGFHYNTERRRWEKQFGLFGDESLFERLCRKFVGWVWATDDPHHHYLDRMPLAACRFGETRWRIIINDRSRIPYGITVPPADADEDLQESPEEVFA